MSVIVPTKYNWKTDGYVLRSHGFTNDDLSICWVTFFKDNGPELCASNIENGNFIFNIGLLYVTNAFKSFSQKVKLIFDMFFRHLKPQGVADFTESALLSGS
jgi:hypothetical protein